MIINLFGQPEIASPLPDGVQYFDITNEKVCTHVNNKAALHVHV